MFEKPISAFAESCEEMTEEIRDETRQMLLDAIVLARMRMITKRYWISWISKGADMIEYPPPTPIAACWCSSGSDAKDDSLLFAIVHAESASAAKDVIEYAWLNEITAWRFCEERAADWLPNDSFPISADWEKERLGLAKVKK